MDSDDELRRCSADVTGNDVIHKVRSTTDEMSSIFVSRQQLTGSIIGEEEASRSKLSLSTADFSQQTVQDGATQTPAPLHLCSFDVNDGGIGKSSTTVRVLSGLDKAVTSCSQTMAPESWWTRLIDSEGYYLSLAVFTARQHSLLC